VKSPFTCTLSSACFLAKIGFEYCVLRDEPVGVSLGRRPHDSSSIGPFQLVSFSFIIEIGRLEAASCLPVLGQGGVSNRALGVHFLDPSLFDPLESLSKHDPFLDGEFRTIGPEVTSR